MKQTIATEYVLLLFIAVIWGSSFSLIKIGVEQVGPATLAAGRILIAALALVIWVILIKQIKLNLSPLALSSYAIIGFFGNSLPFALIGWSELAINSSLAAILMGVMPLFTVIMAHFFLEDEPSNLRVFIGLMLGLSGLITLLGFSVWHGLKSEVFAQIAVIIASLCYASVTIFVRRFVTVSGLEIATGAMLAAAIFSLIFAFIFENPTELIISKRSIAPMILLGLFPTALASVLYFRLVRSLGATRFAQINYIIPVVGSFIGIIFLNEPSHWRMWLALTLVLAGIYLVHSARRGTPRIL